MSVDPVVSVSITTYQHAAFIRQCLDSVLMQETSFPIEIIVHDDASTDRTPEIIRDYDRRDPGHLHCILQQENQFSKIGSRVFLNMCSVASGQYIALCEGDDYWTDPEKLEKQVTFMRRYPELSMSFHAARIEYADGSRLPAVHDYPGRRFFDPREVILGGGGFYQTCTALFRRDVMDDYPEFLLRSPVGDDMLALNAISKGTVGYLDQVMAVYNSGVPGSYSVLSRNRSLKERLDFVTRLESARADFDEYTKRIYSKWIRKRASLNKGQALFGRRFDRGCYASYRKLRKSMLIRDRFIFHLRYLRGLFRSWACRKSPKF